MSREIVEAVRGLAAEKNISSEKLMEALEDALLSAYKKTPGAARHAKVEMDRESGDFKVFELKIPPELEEQLLVEGTTEMEPTVDPETGGIEILDYVVVEDAGVLINPMIVEGQIHGGSAQGIAQALYEEVVYDDSGQLLTGSLVDYGVPYAPELPMYESHRTETPSPLNALGVKGVGEAGTIPVAALVAEAVEDALTPFGVRTRVQSTGIRTVPGRIEITRYSPSRCEPRSMRSTRPSSL